MPARDQTTIGAYRQQIVERLFSGHALRPPRRAGAEAGRAVPRRRHQPRACSCAPPKMTSLTARRQGRRPREGPGRAVRRSRPGRRSSASPTTELDRQKQRRLRGLERVVDREATSTRRRRSPTSTCATSCEHEPIPGIAYELALHAALPPRRSRWPRSTGSPRRGCRIAIASSSVSAPQKAGRDDPGRGEAGAIITGGSGSGLTAYVDTVTARPLLEPPPTPGRDRQDDERKQYRHHRVGAVERRPRRAQADRRSAGRDPVPRLQPGRHVAGERRRLHRRRHRRPGDRAAAAWAAGRDRSQQDAGRPHRVGPSRTSTRWRKASSAASRQGRSGDAVPAHLPDVAEPRADPDAFRRHGDAAAGHAREPRRRA